MTLFANRLSLTWASLLLATGLTALLMETEHGVRWATVTVLLIAAAKIGLIMAEFMELRTAPRAWKIAYATWLVAVLAIVLSGFIVG